MKRFLVIFLVLILTFSSVVVCSSADTYTTVNLLDYKPMSLIFGNNFSFRNELDIFYDFTYPINDSQIYGVDILFSVSGADIEYIEFITADTMFELSITDLGNDIYRAFGDNEGYILADLTLHLVSSGFTEIHFHQFNISLVSTNRYIGSASGSLVSGGLTDEFQTSGGSTNINFTQLDVDNANVLSTTFSCYVYPYNAHLYDYIEMCFAFTGLGLDGITVELIDGYQVPFVITPLSNTDTSTNGFHCFNLTIDLTGIDKSDMEALRISLYGRYDAYKTQYFQILDMITLVDVTPPDPELSLLQKIANSISSLLATPNQENQAEDFDETAESQASELDEMVSVMGSVEQPDISNVNLDLTSGIDSNILTATTSGFSTVLSNEILIRVLIMALTLGLVGFILYGKKG